MREYYGAGVTGSLMEQLHTQERQQRETAARAWKQERSQRDQLDHELREWCQQTETAMRHAFIEAGYHQHARGAWRKQRQAKCMNSDQGESQNDTKAAQKTFPKPSPNVHQQPHRTAQKRAKTGARQWQDLRVEEQEEAIIDAQKGSKHALALAIEGMEADHRIADQLTNLAGITRRELISASLGKTNALMQEVLNIKMEQLRADLACEAHDSPLERTLIERIVTCWLVAHLAEIDAARVRNAGATLAKATYYDQRAERQHKQYLSACLALAKTRRLLAPIVAQVNIAQPGSQQLNLAAPALPVNEAIDTIEAIEAEAEVDPKHHKAQASAQHEPTKGFDLEQALAELKRRNVSQ